ncbi:hypothetical protein HMPREF0653_00200, partial [Prevotella disiens JCM 6334 = ATCC 29426]
KLSCGFEELVKPNKCLQISKNILLTSSKGAILIFQTYYFDVKNNRFASREYFSELSIFQ